MCCMWYICSYRTNIIIYSHRVCFFSKTKYLVNSTSNIHNTIGSEYGFKLMFAPHIYCNNKYINVLFTTNFKVDFFSPVLLSYRLYIFSKLSISVHKTNFIETYVSISTNENFITDNFKRSI